MAAAPTNLVDAVKRVNQAKNARTRRLMREKEPKLIENTKSMLCLKGPKSSDPTTKALRDLYMLKKPDSKLFVKRNLTRPFEDQSSVEFLCNQNDSALFTYVSHSKKRPHNIVFGRIFDGQALDMIEFGMNPETFKPMSAFTERKSVLHVGDKCSFIFNGEEFNANPDLAVFRNLFLDTFRGDDIDQVNLAGLDRVMVCTAVGGGKVFLRQYGVSLKKSGTKLPRVELEEVGPRMDLTFRRRKSAADDVQKASLKVPKVDAKTPGKTKNIERNEMGEKTGRVHMHHQNYKKIVLNKAMKGIKRKKNVESGDRDETGEPAEQPTKKQRK